MAFSHPLTVGKAPSTVPPAAAVRRPPSAGDAAAQEARQRFRGKRFLVFLLIVLGVICVVGLPYYTQPLPLRVRNPLHPWLRPSGYVGQSAGILALAIFLFLWLYPLRKKFRWLAFTGAISRWLDMHVVAALAMPLLVAIHGAWRFEGLIGLGFWSMLVVWASGIFGRYIYVRIPRSKAGVELTLEEVAERRRGLIAAIAAQIGLDPTVVEATLSAGMERGAPRGLLSAMGRMLTDDFVRRRAARRLRALWKRARPRRTKNDRAMLAAVLRLARREVALAQQVHMLDATHSMFRYWHVLHRPIAVAALVAVVVHVIVVVAVGATWLRLDGAPSWVDAARAWLDAAWARLETWLR